MFSAIFTHSRGRHYLGYILLLPTPNVVTYTAAGSCLIEYNRISKGMRLINETGDNWLGPPSGVPLSQGGILSNSRCAVDVGGSTANVDGNIMTVKAAVTLDPRFRGVLATFLQALDVDGKWTGMTQFGNWIGTSSTDHKTGPYVVGVSPLSGTGHSAAVTVTLGHTSGTSQLAAIHIRIASSIVGTAPCHVVYFPQSNSVNLVNDEETALVSETPVALATASLSNQRCSIEPSGGSIISRNILTLRLPLSFRPEWGGQKNIYVNAFDTTGKLTHWVQGGTFIVQ